MKIHHRSQRKPTVIRLYLKQPTLRLQRFTGSASDFAHVTSWYQTSSHHLQTARILQPAPLFGHSHLCIACDTCVFGVQAVSLLSRQPWPHHLHELPAKTEQELAGRLTSVRDSALRVIFNVLICLDAWSSPLKEPAAGSSGSSTSDLPPLPLNGGGGSEAGLVDGAGSHGGPSRTSSSRKSKADGIEGEETATPRESSASGEQQQYPH